MNRLARLRAPIAVVASLAVLLAMVELGIRVPGLGWLTPFGGASALDYSAPPLGGFSPLESPYIARVLGSGEATAGGTVDRAGRSRSTRPPDEVDVRHALTNDRSSEAYAVPSVPFRARANTAGAGVESGEPRECAPLGSTVWYRFTPRSTTGLVASTGGTTYASALGIFSKLGSGSWRNIACDSDPRGASEIVFPAVGSTNYFFQITAPVAGGELVFSLAPHESTALLSRDDQGRLTTVDNYGPPKISANGRYALFTSRADNFDRRCPCGEQAYVRDVVTGRTELVSVTHDNKAPNADAFAPNISGDGRFVVWDTLADNVTPGDTNGAPDVFIRDRKLRRTERITLAADGAQIWGHFATVSDDGRYVGFTSTYERRAAAPPLSPPGGDPYWIADGYRKDRVTGKVELATVSSSGERGDLDSGGAISPDGSAMLIVSRASNLVDDMPLDFRPRTLYLDEYQMRHYYHDFKTGSTTLECRSSAGSPSNDSCFGVTMSGDGRYTAFWSPATNLMDEAVPTPNIDSTLHLYMRDRLTGRVTRVTLDPQGAPCGEVYPRNIPATRTALGYIRVPFTSLSYDARYLLFDTDAYCLAPDDQNGALDVFLYDRVSRTIVRVSESSFGEEGNNDSYYPSMSSDGRAYVYLSLAWNLVGDDTNGRRDVFVTLRPPSDRRAGS